MKYIKIYENWNKPTAYGGLVIRDNKVLLREPTSHFDGYAWTFAKGKPDIGESKETTALREVEEETGMRCELLDFIDIPFSSGSSDTYFFIMKMVEDLREFDWETNAIKWVGYEEAVDLVNQTTNVMGRKRDLSIMDYLKDNGYIN